MSFCLNKCDIVSITLFGSPLFICGWAWTERIRRGTPFRLEVRLRPYYIRLICPFCLVRGQSWRFALFIPWWWFLHFHIPTYEGQPSGKQPASLLCLTLDMSFFHTFPYLYFFIWSVLYMPTIHLLSGKQVWKSLQLTFTYYFYFYFSPVCAWLHVTHLTVLAI